MPSDIVYLNHLAPPLTVALTQYVDRTAPGISYAGVAIGDAADGSLLSALHPDRTGADQLFNTVVSPHLGASMDTTA